MEILARKWEKPDHQAKRKQCEKLHRTKPPIGGFDLDEDAQQQHHQRFCQSDQGHSEGNDNDGTQHPVMKRDFLLGFVVIDNLVLFVVFHWSVLLQWFLLRHLFHHSPEPDPTETKGVPPITLGRHCIMASAPLI